MAVFRYPLKHPNSGFNDDEGLVEQPTEAVDYLMLRRERYKYEDKNVPAFYSRRVPGNSAKSKEHQDRCYIAMPPQISTSYTPAFRRADIGVGGISALGMMQGGDDFTKMAEALQDGAKAAIPEFSTAAVLSMINANPALLELLSEVMGGAPFLADRLKKYPILLDHVLEPDFFQLPPDERSLSLELENSLSFAKDFEDVLDITRRHVNDRLFQIGILMLKGVVLPTDASKHLTNIADSALKSVYKRVADNHAERHGTFKYRDIAVIALGKLGGNELTISSDLDLLFIYPDNIEEFSDGREPVSQLPYFTRLAQKFISAMTAPTGQGTLYQIDLRLRPSGNAGPIVSSMRSFIDYYRSMAWTWEHMALTRARVITAQKQFSKTIERNIKMLLTQERNHRKLLLDVADMRSRIEKNKKSAGLWDVKHARGGLIDIEFITQYLQLKYAHSNSEVLATNTAEAIIRLSDSALLNHSHSKKLLEALALWTQIQGILRLTVGNNYNENRFSRPIRALLNKTCESQDFESLKKRVLDLQTACHAIFIELIEDPVEKIRSRNL